MFERLNRSFELVKASWGVLRQDRELVIFPLMSSIALLLVVLAFALPLFGLGAIDALHGRHDTPPLAYVVGFLFYFTNYFVIFFFNTALVGAAMVRLDGGTPTFKDGIRIASSKIAVIAGYALISATVGVLLRVIQERVGFIGKIVVALIGMGWSLATYLVVPVLADREVGPVEAIKESAALFRETWGENVIGRAGISVAFGVIFVGLFIASFFLVFVVAMTKSVALIVLSVLFVVLLLGVTALVQQALEGIYAAALYRYASNGAGAPGFPAEAMQLAFAPKK